MNHPAFDANGLGDPLLGKWLSPRGLLIALNVRAEGGSDARSPTDAELINARRVYRLTMRKFGLVMPELARNPRLGPLIVGQERDNDECELLLLAIGVIRLPGFSMPRFSPDRIQPIRTGSGKSRPRRRPPPGRVTHGEETSARDTSLSPDARTQPARPSSQPGTRPESASNADT